MKADGLSRRLSFLNFTYHSHCCGFSCDIIREKPIIVNEEKSFWMDRHEIPGKLGQVAGGIIRSEIGGVL